jgi:hypothetical protein
MHESFKDHSSEAGAYTYKDAGENEKLLFIELVMDPVNEPFGQVDLFEVKLVHSLQRNELKQDKVKNKTLIERQTY